MRNLSTNSFYNKFKHVLSDSERKLLCDSVFYLINWFVELINAFSVEIKPISADTVNIKVCNEISHMLVMRLTNIWELQALLVNILPAMKFYRPPMAVFGLVDSSADEMPYVHSLIKVKEVGKKKATKRQLTTNKKKTATDSKRSKKNNDGDEEELEELAEEKEDEEAEKTLIEDDEDNKENSPTTVSVDLNKFSVYFREFDLIAINFVNLELDLSEETSENESMTHEMANTRPKIKPHLLHFILGDFNRKVNKCLFVFLYHNLIVCGVFLTTKCCFISKKRKKNIKLLRAYQK